jgi:Zn-dependent protease with chaperone function
MMKNKMIFASRPEGAVTPGRRILFVLAAVLLTGLLLVSCQSALKSFGTGVSDSIEAPLSKSLAASVVEQTPLVEDKEALAYINSLCQRIGAKSDRSDLTYQAWIVDSDDINAFTVGGGYLFFNKGLIARSRNESELAGVVSHEIGHCVARHITQKLITNMGISIVTAIATGQDPSRSRQIAGGLLGVGGGLLGMHFSRDNEREADSLGVEQLLSTGIDPSGLPTFFGTLRDFYGDRGGIEMYFAEHPPLGQRITNTQRIIQNRSAVSPNQGQLSKDSATFRQIRDQMKWLTRYAGMDTVVVEAGKHVSFSTMVDFKQAADVSVEVGIEILAGSPANIRLVVTDTTGYDAFKNGQAPRSNDFAKTVSSGQTKINLMNGKKFFFVLDNSMAQSGSKRLIIDVRFRYRAL